MLIYNLNTSLNNLSLKYIFAIIKFLNLIIVNLIKNKRQI